MSTPRVFLPSVRPWSPLYCQAPPQSDLEEMCPEQITPVSVSQDFHCVQSLWHWAIRMQLRGLGSQDGCSVMQAHEQVLRR